MTFGSFQIMTPRQSCADSDAPTMPNLTSKYQHTGQQVPSAIGKHNGRDAAIGGSMQQGIPIV